MAEIVTSIKSANSRNDGYGVNFVAKANASGYSTLKAGPTNKVSADQLKTLDDKVAIASVVNVGWMNCASGSFVRPNDNTAYAIGDTVSSSTGVYTVHKLADVARRNGSNGYIVAAKLSTNHRGITPSFRVHLFSSVPSGAVDNAPFSLSSSDYQSKKIGDFVLGPMSSPTGVGNLSQALDTNIRVPFQCASNSRDLYYSLETLTAYTPSGLSGYTLETESDQN